MGDELALLGKKVLLEELLELAAFDVAVELLLALEPR